MKGGQGFVAGAAALREDGVDVTDSNALGSGLGDESRLNEHGNASVGCFRGPGWRALNTWTMGISGLPFPFAAKETCVRGDQEFKDEGRAWDSAVWLGAMCGVRRQFPGNSILRSQKN